jgi:hypothetical protein
MDPRVAATTPVPRSGERRYRRARRIGGAIEGAMLGWVFSLDGTLFPEAPPGAFAAVPLGLAGVLLAAGVVGAVLGLAIGLAGGLVLGFPLAAVLGSLKSVEPGGRR